MSVGDGIFAFGCFWLFVQVMAMTFHRIDKSRETDLGGRVRDVEERLDINGIYK